MARKPKMQMIIDAAIADASSLILKNTVAAMGPNTTVEELVMAIKGTQLADGFHAMTLSELAAAIQTSSGRGRGPGRPPKAAGRPKAAGKKTAKVGSQRGGSLNTRTAEGRAQLDAAVAAVLQGAPAGLRSEEINSQVPGDTAQIRQSLKRMIAAGEVSKTGDKRATTYSWGGSGKPAKSAAPKRKKAARKKAGRRAGAKKKTSRKKTATKA